MDAQHNTYHPLLLEIIYRLESTGAGYAVESPDGHLFFQPCVGINDLGGALDLKKEGEAAGVRIIVRKARKRSKHSPYAKMPLYQLYTLPIIEKNADTMTDAERRNSDIYRQALRLAHAVERDPEQRAIWLVKHEAHRANPRGYSKLYPNFFGFLVATFRMQLAAQYAAESALVEPPAAVDPAPVEPREAVEPAFTLSIAPALNAGITLCVPTAARIATPRPRARSIPLHPPRRRQAA